MSVDFDVITFDVTTPEGWANARRWLVGKRKRMRLTQVVVAERMGATQSQVSEFERGLTDPHPSTMMRYVRALGLVAGWNVFEKES